MEEKEYKALIDRATSVAQVKENFSGIAGIDTIVKLSMTTMLKIYKDVLSYYRADESANFGTKYLEDWQKAFMNIPSVAYNDNPENNVFI